LYAVSEYPPVMMTDNVTFRVVSDMMLLISLLS